MEDESEKKLMEKESLETLRESISKLAQSQKDLLYFKYLLDMKDEEIAKIFDIAPNSVRQYLTRARRNARKLIETEVVYNVK